MLFFVNCLRALAAVLITNSHYEGIYPTDIIANGGLLGDILFFAVSGFCLCSIKLRFDKWYLKRIVRIYPAVWIITLVYLCLGLYTMNKGVTAKGIFEHLIYPTRYHFVASIMVLYILFYIFMSINKIKENIWIAIAAVFVVWMGIYIFAYDKSIYHIDVVREPMIRFLYFEAMLMGSAFSFNREKYLNKNKLSGWICAGIFFVIYFGSKLVFSKGLWNGVNNYQIVNQILILICLYFIFKSFMGIESVLKSTPYKIRTIIEYISEITLEIYVVQYGILPLFKKWGRVLHSR